MGDAAEADKCEFVQGSATLHKHTVEGQGSHHHSHGHGNSHGHSHEALEHPGHFHKRERPLSSARDFKERAFTVGIGGPVGKRFMRQKPVIVGVGFEAFAISCCKCM